MINFEKRREMSDIVFDIQKMQQQPFTDLSPLPNVRQYLETYHPLSARRIAELAQQEFADGNTLIRKGRYSSRTTYFFDSSSLLLK